MPRENREAVSSGRLAVSLALTRTDEVIRFRQSVFDAGEDRIMGPEIPFIEPHADTLLDQWLLDSPKQRQTEEDRVNS